MSNSQPILVPGGGSSLLHGIDIAGIHEDGEFQSLVRPFADVFSHLSFVCMSAHVIIRGNNFEPGAGPELDQSSVDEELCLSRLVIRLQSFCELLITLAIGSAED